MSETTGFDIVSGTFGWLADGLDWFATQVNEPGTLLRKELGLGDADTFGLTDGLLDRIRLPDRADLEEFSEAVRALAEASRALSEFSENLAADGLDLGDAGDVLALIARIMMSQALLARKPGLHALALLLTTMSGVASQDDIEALDVFRSVNLFGGRSNVESDASSEVGVDTLMAWIGIASAITTSVLADSDKFPDAFRVEASFGYDPPPNSTTSALDAEAANALTLRLLERIADSDTPIDTTQSLTIVNVPALAGTHGAGVFLSLSVNGAVHWKDVELAVEADQAFSALFTDWSWYPHTVGVAGGSRLAVTAKWGTGDHPLVDSKLGGIGILRIDALEGQVSFAKLEGGVRNNVKGTLTVKGLTLDIDLKGTDALLGSFSDVLGTAFDLGFEWDRAGFRPKFGKTKTPAASSLRALTTPDLAAEVASGADVDALGPPAAKSFGPFTILENRFHVGSSERPGFSVRVSVDIAAAVSLGPVTFVVDGLGIALDVRPPSTGITPNLVIVDTKAGIIGPTAVGIVIDTSIVTGGGFLEVDRAKGRYAGVISLEFGSIGVSGLVLVQTKSVGKAPWTALILLFADFESAPIQLGLGFTLTGVGGVLGLHHQTDDAVFRDAAGTDAFDAALFPPDVVKNAPTILARLGGFFPAKADSLVVGPAFRVEWGTPAIVTIKVALLVDLDGALRGSFKLSRITMIGSVRATAPRAAAGGPRLIDIGADFVGSYDFDSGLLAFDAQIRKGSTIGGVEPTGTVIIRAGLKGTGPKLLMSAGGFHPAFHDLPPNLPARIDRLGFHWSLADDHVQLDLKAYVALTPSSWQFGAAIYVDVKFGSVGLDGHLAFNTIAYDDGRFRADIDGGVHITWHGHSLCGVDVDMVLERRLDRTWNARGSATFEIGWWDKSIDFDKSWGSPRTLPASPARNLLAEVRAALDAPSNWEVALPSSASTFVKLAQRGTVADDELVAHPLAALLVRQQIAPLGLPLDHLDDAPISGPARVAITTVSINGTNTDDTEEVLDTFTLGRFLRLSDDELLASSGFERHQSGLTIRREAFQFGPVADEEVTFETISFTDSSSPQPVRTTVGVPGHLQIHLETSDLSLIRRATTLDSSERARIGPPRYDLERKGSHDPAPGALTPAESRSKTLAMRRARALGLQAVRNREPVPG